MATPYIKADGTRAFSGSVSMGSNTITSVGTPSSATDAATKGYVDGVAQGLNQKYSARAATVGTETFTITSGSVALISGTTIDGQSPAVGEYILVKDAPASTGTGSVGSSQPGNGLYQVTNATSNLTLVRAADMTGTNAPTGSYTFVEAGTTWAATGWVVTTPSTNAAFTYGTGNIQYTQFSGAGDITVDSTITKTGNQLVRTAITGDVSVPGGSNTSTIGAAAVTLAKMANLAANSVIGNSTGSGATPTAVPMSATPGASTVAQWDANSNLSANALFGGLLSTATAAGTTTLGITSAPIQVFTGSSTQTVKLPTTSVPAGAQYTIVNQSSGAVTVQSSNSNLITIVNSACSVTVQALVATPTTSANWTYQYFGLTVSGGKSLNVANTLSLIGTDGTNFTFPSGSDTVAGLAATQTLTNKTISGSSNTLSNIALASLAGAAYSSLATASTLAYRDTSGNLKVNNYARSVATTVTAAGTTTLVVGSPMLQQFTGTTTQTVVLPDATTMMVGATYNISNQSTGVLTINMNGGTLLRTVPGNTTVNVALMTNGTAAGTWDPGTTAAVSGGSVTTVSVVTANGLAGTVSNATTTPAITLTTSVTGVLKGNGTAISAATASTDYMAPSSFIIRETPTGTINGSTTAFTLANTPISGTEEVFLNGVLQDSGAGNDYTISTNTITMLAAPVTGDKLRVNYQK